MRTRNLVAVLLAIAAPFTALAQVSASNPGPGTSSRERTLGTAHSLLLRANPTDGQNAQGQGTNGRATGATASSAPQRPVDPVALAAAERIRTEGAINLARAEDERADRAENRRIRGQNADAELRRKEAEIERYQGETFAQAQARVTQERQRNEQADLEFARGMFSIQKDHLAVLNQADRNFADGVSKAMDNRRKVTDNQIQFNQERRNEETHDFNLYERGTWGLSPLALILTKVEGNNPAGGCFEGDLNRNLSNASAAVDQSLANSADTHAYSVSETKESWSRMKEIRDAHYNRRLGEIRQSTPTQPTTSSPAPSQRP